MPVQLEHDIVGSYDTSKSSTIMSSLSSLLCCRRWCGGCCSDHTNDMMDGDTIRRCFVLLLIAAGTSLSVLVAMSCEFFAYQTLDGEPWPNLTPPFNELTSAGVGLFSYTTQSSTVTGDGLSFDTCTPYSEEFVDEQQEISNSSFFVAAQYCAIIAPVAAFLALVSHVSEIACCRIKGSYHINAFLLLSATILQGATFLIFADGTFCFDAASQNQCRLGSGAWFSFGAIVSYLVVVIISTSLLDYPTQGTCGICFELTQLKTTSNKEERNSHGDGDIETGRGGKFGDATDSSQEEPSTGGSSDTSDTEKVQNYESERDNAISTDKAGDKFIDANRQNSAMGSPRNDGTSTENDVTVPTHSIDAEVAGYHHEDDDDMIVAGAQSSSITMRPVSPSTHHRSSGGFFDMCCAGDTVPAPKVEESG